MILEVKNTQQMETLGQKIGSLCKGSELIELIGDIGAGKTTLTRGFVRAFGVEDTVQSPTFTISRIYETERGVRLAHYDFYRLQNPGVMAIELGEAIQDPQTVVLVEWANSVAKVLPGDRLIVSIKYTPDGDTRRVEITAGGPKSKKLLSQLS